MKHIYTTGTIFSIILLLGCSKDFLKSYDRRIVGVWEITDVNRNGIGGNTSGMPFKEGIFTFNNDGTLQYQDQQGVVYQGSWDISKRQVDDVTLRTLMVTAVDFANQRVLSEHYDDMAFVGTDHFKAKIIYAFHTYVTHFRR